MAAEDFHNAVTPVFDFVVRAEQAGFWRGVVRARTSYKHMAYVDLTKHLGREIGEFRARGEAIEVGLVFGLDFGNAEPVGVGVVEKVAFDPPRFEIDLPPACARIDRRFHTAQVERLAWVVVAGLQIVGRSDGPAVVALIEHLRSVEGNLEVIQIVEDHFRLALLQRESPDGVNIGAGLLLRRRPAKRRPFAEIDDARFAGRNKAVVTRRNGQRQDAIADTVEIDRDFNRLILILILIVFCRGLIFISGFVRGRLVILLLRVGRLAWLVRLFFFYFFVVALRRNGGRAVFGENYNVGRTALGAVQR